MVDGSGANMSNVNNTEGLQPASESISYSVNAQELLKLSPEPLLESDLLALDDSALKSELNDDIDITLSVVNAVESHDVKGFINCLSNSDIQKTLGIENSFKMETRRNKHNMESEEQLLSCVYSITDKPVLTRARASLPKNAIFAKKTIPKSTQFGPLEGIVVNNGTGKSEEKPLMFLLETEGLIFRVDVSDENTANWITSYAQHFDLPVLQPQGNITWPCYGTSIKIHILGRTSETFEYTDEEKDENTKPRKRFTKIENVFSKVSNRIGRMNYKCEICNMGFKTEALLKIHNLEHDPDSLEEQLNHICPSCQRKFPTQRQLVIHISIHALPNVMTQCERIKCPVCYKMFALQERLQKHMLVHGSEESKPLQCKTCNKRFLNNSALACHIKTHFIGKKVFECPICKESFDHVLKLKLHVPKHCDNNCFTCPHCKKIFKKYSIIRKHIRAFHCERKHTCQHCSKMFPTQDKLRMHLLRHSDHREFLCADCGKQFKRKDKLKEHCKRMHTEERENTIPKSPKPTTPSNKKFTPKVEPTDFHRFIYKCHSCLVGFKRRGMLVNHLAKRHPDIRPDSVPELNLPILQTTRDYYCQYCDKVYKSSSKRKAHILKNHPGAALPMSNRKAGKFLDYLTQLFSQTVGSITTRPQSCKWCHKQYASKAKLLQHQRKKHPDQIASDVQVTSVGTDINDGNVQQKVIKVHSNIQDKFESVNVGDILENEIEDYIVEEDSQYCQINKNSGSFIEADKFENPNSHLYRLLTTSNGMLPPR
ncbi:hypothetical protein NQ317_002244 [Molorchus minor]|uniref:C2H2-type domain-containing protein n=1 Tax=Molorchus minor TaxID=1323400 RepID=A0ABQ9JDC8_9CUCU|nr:hypothetical protein NQ317_002244 [Molorchus minor]